MENQDLEKTAALLEKNYGLATEMHPDWESLREALFQQISYMLREEFERLVQTMYRLDVNEGKFQKALSLPQQNEQAVALAEIVLAREKQRLETWRKYSQG